VVVIDSLKLEKCQALASDHFHHLQLEACVEYSSLDLVTFITQVIPTHLCVRSH
jgi:hypothetical protein